MAKRILLAGLFHETHTFLEGTTGLDDFAERRGRQLFDAEGDGSPLSGVLEVADECGWDVVPAVDLRATPSATVEDSVVEHFWQEFYETVQRERTDCFDAVYLVLHGAMCAQTIRDVEGEIVDRIRHLPELADVPVCGVLDLHGNISRRTVEKTQGLIAYRKNPHTDSRAAAVDGARLLDRILNEGRQPVCVWEHPPVMWPPTGTGTADDPMKSLEAMARDVERAHPEIVAVNVLGGFSFADTPDAGVSFSAITFGNPETAAAELRRMSGWTVDNRELGNVLDTPLDQVVPQVKQHVEQGDVPVVLVEPSDNIGGGAPGDGTTILRLLIAEGIRESAVVINDAKAAARLQSAEVGATVRLPIGGKGSRLTDGPLELDVEMVSTSDGRFDLEDRQSHLASMNGIHINMGPCATVRHQGIHILLTSRKTPPFDLGQLRSQGIVPESLHVVGVKAAVAHRRAYDKITGVSYTVATPGPCSSDLRTFPFEHVRRPIFPLDDV